MPLITNQAPVATNEHTSAPLWQFDRWSNTRKRNLYFELHLLLMAGLDIHSALTIMIESLSSQKLKNDLIEIQKLLVRGKSLSEAFASNKSFSVYEITSLHIGTETGKTTEVLQSLALYFEERDKLLKSVRSALAYPIFVLCVALLVVWFLLKYLVPMFSGIFNRFGGDLPTMTKNIVALSNIVAQHGFLIVLVFGVGAFGLYRLLAIPTYQRRFHVILDKTPFIGAVYRETCFSQMYMSLQLLLESRVQLLHSLEQVNKMINYHPLNLALSQIIEQMPRGITFSDALKRTGYFKPREVAMLKIGEETSTLPLILKKLSAQYQESLSRKVALLNSILEPALILVVGAIVGTILVSIYLPIFKMGIGGPR
jgi:type IV pilus assembly protein PilC